MSKKVVHEIITKTDGVQPKAANSFSVREWILFALAVVLGIGSVLGGIGYMNGYYYGLQMQINKID